MISKALIVAQYQTKAEALARKPGVELFVVTPPQWRDERGVMKLEKEHVEGYQFITSRIRCDGHYHIHYYPDIGEIIDRVQPDLIHIDEEPYNFATFHALFASRRATKPSRSLFFTWQNLEQAYPPPFSWMESYVYDKANYALAGNSSAKTILRSKGFKKPIRVVPQFGVDPAIFYPEDPQSTNGKFEIGFAARLVPEKGASLLLSALKDLKGDWGLKIVGGGPERSQLENTASLLGIAERIHFLPWQPSTRMPRFFRELDVLVAPSKSRPNWTEQFGRVLIEAMACAVPVIGSSAGEIPNVIGDAGLVFSEGDENGLRSSLELLMGDPLLRTELGKKGRARVLERFTQGHIADETYAVYRELLR